MLEQKDVKSIKDAYEILGLEVGASKEELEKKYTMLIKKYRSLVLSEDEVSKAEGEKQLKEVTDAYNSIIENELEAIRAKQLGKPNPVFKKMGVDERKAKNIIHYYKYHFIFGLLGVILLGYIIYGFATRVEPDFNLTVIGSFYSQDSEPLKQKIKEGIPEIKEPTIEVITINEDAKDQQSYAMQMKAVAVIAAGDIDVFILDKNNFDKYAAGSAFMELDKAAEDLNIDKSKYFSLKPEDKAEEHVYGLDVSSSKLLEGILGEKNEKIAAISVKTENYEKALKMVELLMK